MKAGPKGAITAPPLDLAQLPRSGPRRVEAFARDYLKVTRGMGARGPFRLRPWQKQIVGQLPPSSGSRPRQALLSLPRGNGKTSLAAVLGVYGLYADGVESAEVVVVASDARQAGVTLRQIARMVELEPRLAEQTQVFQSRLYVPHTDSTLVVLPAEPGALQGWNPSLAIVDELHVVHPPGLGCRVLGRRQTRPVAHPGDQHTGARSRRCDVGPGGVRPPWR